MQLLKMGIRTRMAKAVSAFIVLTYLLAPAAGIKAGAQTSGEFSVKAVIPDNQVDTRQTYFDLRMKPGEKQTVQIVISNSRMEELTAQIRLNAASTGRNGLIVYTEPGIRDESLKVAITDVATLGAETVTVPASGTTTVNIDIQMPEEELDGVILGGIVVTADETGNNTQATEGIALKNTITYVIGLKITENDKEVAPDFDLTAITPSLVNYRTAMAVTLHNKVPRIAKGMQVQAQVYRSGSDTVLYDLALDNAEMAPLTKGDFVIDWGGKALQPGTYRLKMTAKYEDRLWEWDEEFTIAGEAGELNKEAVGLEKDYRWLYLTGGLLLLVLVALLAFWLGRRKKKND